MTCANHPDAAAAAYCRTCGKPLCAACKREAEGTVFCAEHVPVSADTTVMGIPSTGDAAPPPSGQYAGANAGPSGGASAPPDVTAAYASPYTSPYTSATPYPPTGVRKDGPSPALALILGLIPGVGAIYNGQYAKGLIHAVVFGILVSLLDSHNHSSMAPLLGILLAAWVFYMAFEAYHTAKARREGTAPHELSQLVQMDRTSGRFPVAALVLIGIGGLLLLDTTNLISIDRLFHFWPVGLILIGAYMLYERMGPGGPVATPPAQSEAGNDRR
jgi:TM2 domain-containing membrane protein YozV